MRVCRVTTADVQLSPDERPAGRIACNQLAHVSPDPGGFLIGSCPATLSNRPRLAAIEVIASISA
jgi:hypothetical protein